jgi:hypothetical protein
MVTTQAQELLIYPVQLYRTFTLIVFFVSFYRLREVCRWFRYHSTVIRNPSSN